LVVCWSMYLFTNMTKTKTSVSCQEMPCKGHTE
jgi:hypothetical protein